jgi:peptide/nickel transport system substrate-binding protein
MHRSHPASVVTSRRFLSVLIAAGMGLAALTVGGPGSGLASSSARGAAGAHLNSRTHIKVGGTVVIDNVSGSLWTCGFNPYGASTAMFSAGVMYEPLVYVNPLNNSSRPWLASSYSWGNGNKTLTFTIRSGVKWSDGKPLTAADVVFTFDMLKKFSGLDLQAVWTVLSGVKQQGNKVVFTFKKPAVPFFYYLADQDYIVPQHIWSKIKNPVTDAVSHPVGSGPFLLKQCSPQNITYVRNPHYWQKGKPYISEVRYPAFLDNQPGNLYLAQGKANWGGQYIPNVDAYYLSKDRSNRHIWYPPGGGDTTLYLNQTVYPLNILAVRQAISLGIDRKKVSQNGVYGYLPPANQSGIVLPNFKSWYDQSLASKYNYSYNPQKAMKLLKSAGFKMGSNGIFKDKNGKPLSLSIINVGGFTDWVAENEIIRDSLRQIGIDIKVEELSGNDHTAREQNGNFQIAYDLPTGGPAPYYQYRQLLHSANTAPIGKTASSNFERFKNKTVDRLLNSYAQTTNVTKQHQIINQLQQVMLRDVPVVPVLEGVNWFQYDTSQLTGWPTPSNPYASPSPYNYPDWEVVLTNVHMK